MSAASAPGKVWYQLAGIGGAADDAAERVGGVAAIKGALPHRPS